MKIVYILAITLASSLSFGKTSINKHPLFGSFTNLYLEQTDGSLNSTLVEFSEGINPKSYSKSWKTEGPKWVDKVKNASDVATLSSAYLTLAEQIKPKFFKPSWEKSKDKWVKQVKEARSNLALAGLLKSFYNNLKPEVFTKDWPSKGAQWLEMLNNIE